MLPTKKNGTGDSLSLANSSNGTVTQKKSQSENSNQSKPSTGKPARSKTAKTVKLSSIQSPPIPLGVKRNASPNVQKSSTTVNMQKPKTAGARVRMKSSAVLPTAHGIETSKTLSAVQTHNEAAIGIKRNVSQNPQKSTTSLNVQKPKTAGARSTRPSTVVQPVVLRQDSRNSITSGQTMPPTSKNSDGTHRTLGMSQSLLDTLGVTLESDNTSQQSPEVKARLERVLSGGLHNLPSLKSKVVRVFLSSTFTGM